MQKYLLIRKQLVQKSLLVLPKYLRVRKKVVRYYLLLRKRGIKVPSCQNKVDYQYLSFFKFLSHSGIHF